MSATQWVKATACDNIPLREGRAVTFGGRELAIFNMGDRFLATDNQCPHKGGPLCDGIVTGDSVVCPLHAWKVRRDSRRWTGAAGSVLPERQQRRNRLDG